MGGSKAFDSKKINEIFGDVFITDTTGAAFFLKSERDYKKIIGKIRNINSEVRGRRESFELLHHKTEDTLRNLKDKKDGGVTFTLRGLSAAQTSEFRINLLSRAYVAQFGSDGEEIMAHCAHRLDLITRLKRKENRRLDDILEKLFRFTNIGPNEIGF